MQTSSIPGTASLTASLSPKPLLADVSVVIPTVGRSILESCLFHIASGTHWPAAVIVVDQGGKPEVRAMMRRLTELGVNAVYIPSSQTGRSAGINRGLERVDTRFVTITDDDCFVAPAWLETMTGRLRRCPDQILTGRVELAGNDEVAFSTVPATEPKIYVKPTLRVHPFIGGNAGMAMALVERIGPFDEHACLASAEDSDYGYRALRLRIPIAYDPQVVLYHYHWRNTDERIARYADYARSQGGFYGTHLRRGDPLILLQTLRDLLRSPMRWLRGLVLRDRELAANGRASTLNLLPGIAAGWRRRTFPLRWSPLRVNPK
jgi:GT2 family glycosyltransferase